MSERLPAEELRSPRRREKGTIRRLLVRGHALTECGHAAGKVAEVPTVMAPVEGSDYQCLFVPALRLLLTTSLDKRISTQSVVNSQTSRKSTLMACASASASSIELISKRKTKSPPYLARSVDGGRASAGALPLALVKPVWGGMCQMV